MGVIKRQTIKGSIYSSMGVAVGSLNTILSVKLLSSEQMGLTAILIAVSALYAQFSVFGFPKVVERLFPYFRNKDNKHNGFVFLTIAVGLIGFTISLASFFILKPYLIESHQAESPILEKYILPV
jgi:O-antigen/teichoic acid export membrane protein